VTTPDTLLIADLLSAYRSGRRTVTDVIERLLQTADDAADRSVWITRLPRNRIMAQVQALAGRGSEALPLYGIPFVIKDNIDLAGVPTTAACPEYAYTPAQSAPVVEQLVDAGAILLGKTNLDQFATGLVGTRSPYGACKNSFDARYISGGSSSGSAVAVATGLASFALGTDTAGSGRVPAAFNNLIGLKPSLGRLSTRGVVPACRSLDCVSIFALSADDAGRVLHVASGYDAEDPYSRSLGTVPIAGMRFGVPRPSQLQFFGDADYARLFEQAAQRFESLGGIRTEIDFEPFVAAARLLYGGPWVAERYAAVGSFLQAHPDALHPVTREIIAAGSKPSAVEAFQAQYRLMALKRASAAAWAEVDVLLTPTAGTIYTIGEMQADPIALNSNLGYYTNFMNFFDLAGVAVPAGFRADGLPFGVTLVGPHSTEQALLQLAARLHAAAGGTVGASATPVPPPGAVPPASPGHLALAVCGAHMEGLPLNRELTERGAYLLQRTHTAAKYRLYALQGSVPPRPGLMRVARDGAAIELEVWAVPMEHVGSFLAGIPQPLGLGKLELADGSPVSGFICEGYAIAAAVDVTAFGGWRRYLNPAGPGE
jgi:allophanate hydrolase